MPELLAPTLRLQVAWREAHDEWGPGLHEDGFGILPEDEVTSSAGFATWIERITHQSTSAAPLAEGAVLCTYRWIVEGDRVLGGIALRHELNDRLFQEGGHIGYGIRPTARRQGLASWALDHMLDEARILGLERVLVVCSVENVASARTIEHCGGVLEDTRETERGFFQRYWIDLSREI
jgi:predicted acetyltransferase